MTGPPPDGDELSALARRLHVSPAALEYAVASLEHAGLASRSRTAVRATAAALRFDELWPIR